MALVSHTQGSAVLVDHGYPRMIPSKPGCLMVCKSLVRPSGTCQAGGGGVCQELALLPPPKKSLFVATPQLEASPYGGGLLGVPRPWGSAGPGANSFPVPSGTAGVIISLSRIFTKLLLSDEKENTVIFFFISISMELTCFILHLLVKRTRFVRYHTACSRKGDPETRGAGDCGTGYRVHHDVTAEDVHFVSQGWVSLLPPGVSLPTGAQCWCPLCSTRRTGPGDSPAPRGAAQAPKPSWLAVAPTCALMSLGPKSRGAGPASEVRGGLREGGGVRQFCSILWGKGSDW